MPGIGVTRLFLLCLLSRVRVADMGSRSGPAIHCLCLFIRGVLCGGVRCCMVLELSDGNIWGADDTREAAPIRVTFSSFWLPEGLGTRPGPKGPIKLKYTSDCHY